MTQVYKCDICDGLSEFEHNIMIGNKQDHFGDICYNCIDLVKNFIRDERENLRVVIPAPESPEIILEKAKGTLRENGFVFYKPPPTRVRVRRAVKQKK